MEITSVEQAKYNLGEITLSWGEYNTYTGKLILEKNVSEKYGVTYGATFKFGKYNTYTQTPAATNYMLGLDTLKDAIAYFANGGSIETVGKKLAHGLQFSGHLSEGDIRMNNSTESQGITIERLHNENS